MNDSGPFFSLILCTLNRNDFVKNFYQTISKSNFKDYEIILVDQNKSNKLLKFVKQFPDIQTVYIKSEKGLSVGRNKGLSKVSGQVVCFPDDDCEYPRDILSKIFNKFQSSNIDLFSVQSRGKDGKISNGNFDKESGKITKYNLWSRVISYTIFVRTKKIGNLKFDENLGVGTKTIFKSGEESDFVIQILNKKNINTYYDHTLFIYHPHLKTSFEDIMKRIENYAPGKAYVLKKHKYPIFYQLIFAIFPILKGIIKLILFDKKSNLQFLIAKKRIEGLIKYRK